MNFLEVKQAVQNIMNTASTKVVSDIGLFVNMAQDTLQKELVLPDFVVRPTQLSTPVIASVVLGAGTIPASTVTYRVTATDAFGETLGSAEVSLILAAPGGAVITWGEVTNAVNYNVYGRTLGAELFIATVAAPIVTYTDSGAITPAGALPVLNTTYSLRTGQNTFPLPSDYMSLISLSLADMTLVQSMGNLTKMSTGKYEDFYGLYPTTRTGQPLEYMREGSNFLFDSYADKDYAVRMVYEKKLTALSADKGTNFWTINASKLLIYRACVESYLDDPQYAVWMSVYEDELRRWRVYARKEVLSGSKQRYVPINYYG